LTDAAVDDAAKLTLLARLILKIIPSRIIITFAAMFCDKTRPFHMHRIAQNA
jgi:hypothetical protein